MRCPAKQVAKGLIVGQMSREQLEGGALARFDMLAGVHGAHAAAAEEALKSVGAELFEGHAAGGAIRSEVIRTTLL